MSAVGISLSHPHKVLTDPDPKPWKTQSSLTLSESGVWDKVADV
jgi:hypothetical protein